jgi:hypothetical protein
LLATAASVAGQLAPPEVGVYYVNDQASPTVCTPSELSYIDSKIVPDLDMALITNNFETPEWEFSSDSNRRQLNRTCNWCSTMYPDRLCNVMYNCGFRRQLRQDAMRNLDTTELGAEFLVNCQDNIALLSTTNPFLSQACKSALAGATCYVEFV